MSILDLQTFFLMGGNTQNMEQVIHVYLNEKYFPVSCYFSSQQKDLRQVLQNFLWSFSLLKSSHTLRGDDG